MHDCGIAGINYLIILISKYTKDNPSALLDPPAQPYGFG